MHIHNISLLIQFIYAGLTSNDSLSGHGGNGELRSPMLPAVWENIARCCEATLDTTNLCSLGISCVVVDILEIPEFVDPLTALLEFSDPCLAATI